MDEGSPRRSLEDTNRKWIQGSYAGKFAIQNKAMGNEWFGNLGLIPFALPKVETAQWHKRHAAWCERGIKSPYSISEYSPIGLEGKGNGWRSTTEGVLVYGESSGGYR